jgi:AAA+ superfamily predicted ATPase
MKKNNNCTKLLIVMMLLSAAAPSSMNAMMDALDAFGQMVEGAANAINDNVIQPHVVPAAKAAAKAAGKGIQKTANALAALQPRPGVSDEQFKSWLQAIDQRITLIFGGHNTTVLRGKYMLEPQGGSIGYDESLRQLNTADYYFKDSSSTTPEFYDKNGLYYHYRVTYTHAEIQQLQELQPIIKQKLHKLTLKQPKAQGLDPQKLAEAAMMAQSQKDAAVQSAQVQAEASKKNFARLIASMPSLLSNPKILSALLLTFGGMTILYHGIPLLLVERPSVVTETSIRTIMDVVRGRKKQESNIEKIVLSPENKDHIQRQITHARRVAQTGKGEYMNLCFYGPPGTGKTMTARAMARFVGADYMIINGAAFEQLSEGEIIKSINNIFRMAQSSKKGVILFVDEAEVVMGRRGGNQETTKARRVINGFLGNITDTHDRKIMLIVATNIPQTLDKAILSRLPQEGWIYFGPPAYAEKERILLGYLFDIGEKEGISVSDDFAQELAPIVRTLPKETTGRDLRALARSVIDRAVDDELSEVTKETVTTVITELEESKKRFSDYSY